MQILTWFVCKRNTCVYYTFDDRAAEEYGTIRTDLERAGTPIGPNDLPIAALARSRDLTLVSLNRREFCLVAALRITDFEGPA